LKKTIEDRKISHAHGLVESTLWKCLYYQKQSKCSMQFQWHSSQRLKNQPWSSSGSTKDHEWPKQCRAKGAMLEVSHDTGTKTDMKMSGTEYKTQIWIPEAMPT
jgi:hypothetical protein